MGGGALKEGSDESAKLRLITGSPKRVSGVEGGARTWRVVFKVPWGGKGTQKIQDVSKELRGATRGERRVSRESLGKEILHRGLGARGFF